jgi:RNA polymerase sigma-70 factor (ECF subfamily)
MEEFEEIYRLYFTDVWRYLLKLTHDENQAEEITAETFFRAMNAIDRFSGKSSLKTWLCAIARNIWLDQLREKKKYTDLSDTAMMRIPVNDDHEHESEMKLQASAVMQTAAKLKEPYRTVFHLRFVDNQSFKQIGAYFGKSENWACVTCHRARQTVRREINEHE